MAFEIPLSAIDGQEQAFKQAVDLHIEKLHAFNTMVGQPRPVAHHLVEAAIKRVTYPVKAKKPDEFVADYTIINDMAKQEDIANPSFEQKIFFLHQQIAIAENEAKHKLLPQKKVRLAAFKAGTAAAKDPKKRTAEEKEDIASFDRVQKAWHKIELQSAQAEHDLADVTPKTIDKWKLPKFK